MPSTEPVSYTVHDELPSEESRVVDEGLGAANDQAAPLHEVQPLSCFARLASGQVVGGAIGRSVFGMLGLASWNVIGSIVVSFVGAVILIWLVRRLK